MTKKRDLLSVFDLSIQEIQEVLDLSLTLKKEWQTNLKRVPLKDKTLVLIFEKPSTRTFVSFDVAINQLGGHSLALPQSSLGGRETIYDIAKTLDRYADGLIIRTFNQDTLTQFAENFSGPVVNALSDMYHPCQALADYQTIVEHKGRRKLKLTYVGDGFNVCHSLITLASKVGYTMTCASPKQYAPQASLVAQVQKEAKETGAVIEVTEDVIAAVKDADVIYTDSWIPMGKETENEERNKAFEPFQINSALLRHAKKDAIVMHCLPAHRGHEITDEVIDGPQSVVFDEAENRLHIQKAILTFLFS